MKLTKPIITDIVLVTLWITIALSLLGGMHYYKTQAENKVIQRLQQLQNQWPKGCKVRHRASGQIGIITGYNNNPDPLCISWGIDEESWCTEIEVERVDE